MNRKKIEASKKNFFYKLEIYLLFIQPVLMKYFILLDIIELKKRSNV